MAPGRAPSRRARRRRLHQALAAQRGGRLHQARTLYRRFLRDDPDDADASHLLGLVEQALGDAAGAEALIRRAIALDPLALDYRFNLAELHAAQGRDALARESYREALALDPAQGDAWLGLAHVLLREARTAEAEAAAREAVRLLPDDAEAHWTLIDVLQAQHRAAECLGHFAALARLQGEGSELLLRWARALIDAGEPAAALAKFRQVLAREPGDRRARDGKAAALLAAGEGAAASELYRRALRDSPDAASYYGLALCHERAGQFVEAVENHRAALALEPDFGPAHAHLSLIRSHRADVAHRAGLQRLLETGRLSPAQREQLLFAAARFAEQDAEHARAFTLFDEANGLHRERHPFSPHRFAAHQAHLRQVHATRWFEAVPATKASIDAPRLVFIVGMPRSGSTLLEQMLAAHSQVEGAGELDALRRMVRTLPMRLGGAQPYPQCLQAGMSATVAAELRAQYVGELRRAAPSGAVVCDKQLGNFLRLGLIARLFPQAKIIDVRREPMATCWSCYTQQFEHGLRFCYDLGHLGFVYRHYCELMDHWHAVLPNPLYTLSYESLVEAPERELRALLDFLELDYQGACLDFHHARRSVATASFWQVRQPLYRDALERWRSYELWLEPLRAALRR